MQKQKVIEPIAFYEELDKQPARASYKRVIEMLTYLKECGYIITAWKRFDKPWWQLRANQWYWECRSHKEAYNHLYPFYYQEKQKAYTEWMKQRNERYLKELEKEKNEKAIHSTKLL